MKQTEHVMDIRLSKNISAEDHPSAKAMDELMSVMMDCLTKHFKNPTTKFLEIPHEVLIVMITNNILMNLFLRFYSGGMGTLLGDAGVIADDLKTVFLDCIQKVFLDTADKSRPN